MTEPNLIDYYNELPYGINVIDKMNQELEDLQKENTELKERIVMYQQKTFTPQEVKELLKTIKKKRKSTCCQP